MAPRKKPALTKQKQRRKATFRERWPLTWAGNLLSSILIAAATAAVTVVVTRQTEADTTVTAAAASGPPVIINSVQVVQRYPFYAFSDPIRLTSGQLADLNHNGAAFNNDPAWFTQRGSVEVNQSYVLLVVTGNVPGGTRITGIDLDRSCAAPLNGTIFYDPDGGDQQQSIAIDFNLDAPLPLAQTPAGGDYFLQDTIELADSEQHALTVEATTSRSSCTYTLQLDVLDGSRTIREAVPGGPFRVTAYARHYTQVYVGKLDTNGEYAFTAVNAATWMPPQ